MSGRVIGGGGGGSGGGGLSIASMGRNRPSANGAASSGSRPNSRPNSRPGSRPASRRGSNAFLNEDHNSALNKTLPPSGLSPSRPSMDWAARQAAAARRKQPPSQAQEDSPTRTSRYDRNARSMSQGPNRKRDSSLSSAYG